MLWSDVLRCGNLAYADVLLSHDALPQSALSGMYFTSDEAFDWAIQHGLEVASISVASDRQLLIRAAGMGISPAHPNTAFSGKGGVEEGRKHIIKTFDYELIKAFLENGLLDGADFTPVFEGGDEALIQLVSDYGIPAPTTLVRGESCVQGSDSTGRKIVVPSRITTIAPFAFSRVSNWIKFDAVELPEGLEEIGEGAFAEVKVQSIVLPKTLRKVHADAFFGVRSITVYDSVDPDALPAFQHVDAWNGAPNSELGWICAYKVDQDGEDERFTSTTTEMKASSGLRKDERAGGSVSKISSGGRTTRLW